MSKRRQAKQPQGRQVRQMGASAPFRLSVETWAQRAGTTVPTARAHIDGLIAKGWLVRIGGDMWTLTVPRRKRGDQ